VSSSRIQQQGKDDSGVAAEERSGFIRAKDLPSGIPDLNPLDYKLWAGLEDMACLNRHNNQDNLKRSLVKATAEIPLETVSAVLAEWTEGLKACVGAEGGHFECHYCKQILKLLLKNALGRKVDVLFHLPSRSQNLCNRTHGRTM
jgi:hypothetical protein